MLDKHKTQGEDTGTALILQPGPEFYEEKDEKDRNPAVKGLRFLSVICVRTKASCSSQSQE
jgi:hypothetical protein